MTTIGNGCFVWQKVITTNDRNGNPRRMIMVYTLRHEEYATSQAVWIDNGYESKPTWLKPELELEVIEVSPSEFKRLQKRALPIGPSVSEYMSKVDRT